MGYAKAILLLLATAFCLVTGWESQEQQESVPPGRIQANQTMRRFEKDLHAERPKSPASQPDWQKAQADAARLLTLAQQINAQIQAGPQQVPAHLSEELNEVGKLVKRLRLELIL